MLTRHRPFAIALAVTGFALLVHAAPSLPSKLTDQEFWALTESLSEPDGSFRSDNFLSNERGYQSVIPDLVTAIKPGGVYLGVGPEQNFAYILALKPTMAFIIDIRRGNLHEHLLYKALFEMSADRAEFLSRLFSRKRPAGLGPKSTPEELFAAYDLAPASEDLYKDNFGKVIDWLTKKHRFALSVDDMHGVDYVYHEAFFAAGPSLDYSRGGGGGTGNAPTYKELMLATDGMGVNRGFLASEANFTFLKSFESNNLLVPVVGNFAGPKAVRAVGRYVKEKGGTVVAFYLSNVEQYLSQDGIWTIFCSSVASLPLDGTSTYIFSGRGGNNSRGGRFGGGAAFGVVGAQRGLPTSTRPILPEVLRSCPFRRG